MRPRRDVLRVTGVVGLAGLAGCSDLTGEDQTAAPPTEESTATDSPTAADSPTADQPTNAPAPRWTTGQKHGIATVPEHADGDSVHVWATFTAGAVTETRFPRVDLMNLRTMEFLVVERDGDRAWRTYNVDRTTDDGVTRSTTLVSDEALLYEQTARATTGDWHLSVEWTPDPAREALVGDVAFQGDGYDLYVVARTACSHSAGGDAARRVDSAGAHALAAWDTGANDDRHVILEDGEPYAVALGLACEGGFDRASTLTNAAGHRLLENGVWTDSASAEGVVTLAGRLLDGSGETRVALGFATDRDEAAAVATATEAAQADYRTTRAAYRDAWREYLERITVPDSVGADSDLLAQYRVAAMVVAAVEDKTYRGASIASPSVPWGSATGAMTPRDYGYNFVWARDLYQSFTAMRAMGDIEGAKRAVEYVFEYQQDDDGFVPQNTFIDGRTRWGGEQLDEIAFPLLMAYQLWDRHDVGFETATYEYDDVQASANYVAESGPSTGQERWEEESGYSPSTIAAEIAGLTAAAAIAADRDEQTDALRWLATADEWARSVEDWCATTTGTAEHADTPYYFRVNDDTDPDDGAARDLANGGPTLDERNVIDAGFLELVRLGVVPATDPTIETSVAVVDETIRVETPNGPAWYRYNGDGYGETERGAPWQSDGQGRLWPILTGERGEYELRRDSPSDVLAPENLLEAMAGFANDGRMIPEQVWDRETPTAYGWEFGEGTGSATPLSWAMAQYIRLAHGIDAGSPVETPAVVTERFERERPRPSLTVTDLPTRTEESPLSIEISTDAAEVVVYAGEVTRRTTVTDGEVTVDVPLSQIRTSITVVAVDDADELLDAALALDTQVVTYAGG